MPTEFDLPIFDFYILDNHVISLTIMGADTFSYTHVTNLDDVQSWVGDLATEYDYGGDGDVYMGPESPVVRTAEVAADLRQAVELALSSVACGEQRLAVSRMRNAHVRGRMHGVPLLEERNWTRERRFRIEGYEDLSEPVPDELVDRLRKGRVVTRLGGRPGLGKSRKLPGGLAMKGQMRVCMVSLHAHASAEAYEAANENWDVKKKRGWSREKTCWLTAMTYADFVGIVCSADRKRMFMDTDVFIFDEAHKGTGWCWLAKQCFAVYALEHNSLLVLSATASTDESNFTGSAGLGNTKFLPASKTIAQAMESGALLNTYLRDRLMVIVASDADVWTVKDHFESDGVEVMSLDSASTRQDARAVQAFLSGESCSPRVLVAHEIYGTGSNFPVTFVVTTGTRSEFAEVGGVWKEVEVPLSRAEVMQHVSRTGRGMVAGSGAVVLRSDFAESVDLYPGDRMLAYVGMLAANIKPSETPGVWDDVREALPNGLTREVAYGVLRVGLPPAMTLRYLGTDGGVARRFQHALAGYVQMDHYLRVSKELNPVGYAGWIEEQVGSYYPGDDSSAEVYVKVPFRAEGAHRTVMHGIFAAAQNMVTVPRWRPKYDGEASSEEEMKDVEVRTPRRKIRPRVVHDVPDEEAPEPVVVRKPWAFDASLEAQTSLSHKRKAVAWASTGEGQVVIAQLMQCVDRGEYDPSAGLPTIGPNAQPETIVELERAELVDSPVEVRSPGGSVKTSMPASVYQKFANGVKLSDVELCSLLRSAASAVDALARTVLFDNLSPAWDCVFLSLLDPSLMYVVRQKGLASVATKVVAALYHRFREEVMNVVASSNVYKRRFVLFTRKKSPTMKALMKELREGNFLGMAQSDRYIGRVMHLKELHDEVLMGFETVGVYVPQQVTQAQRPLPLRTKNLVGRLGEDMVPGLRRDSAYAESDVDRLRRRFKN